MKNDLVSAKTGKSSNDMREELIEKEEYNKRQNPEPPKQKTFKEKAKVIADALIAPGYAYKEPEKRGYKEHR